MNSLIKKFLLIPLLASLLILASPQDAILNLATGNLTFQNRTGSSVSLTLSGDHYYSFQLETGKNRVAIEPGKYSFAYEACGTHHNGSLSVRATGTTMQLSKCPKSGNGSSSSSNNSGGPSAICRDGTYSYSKHRSGTCSHHGGVATWLN